MAHPRRIAAILAALLAAAPLGADTVKSIAAEGFGVADNFVTLLTSADFAPANGAAYWSDHLTGDFNAGGAEGILIARLEVPEGAWISGVYVYVNDAASDLVVANVCRNARDYATGALKSQGCPGVGNSSQVDGRGQIAMLFGETFQHIVDVDHDFQPDAVSWIVKLVFPDGPQTAYAAEVHWHRQVSPGPTFANFDDVPLGDPLHPYVEALLAAGLTDGCGGGNYCPHAPVTRAQLAVLLAKALGLHWGGL